MRCEALPGCRPAGALCVEDKDCCSGRCPAAADGGPSRCVRAAGCQPEQERCTAGATCCSGMCNVGPEGGRCAKPPRDVADRCRVMGELCMKADECCAGATCGADGTGRLRCLPAGEGCAAAGYPCAVAAQCCGGWCLPDGSGGYACRDACAPVGAACMAPGDCCTGSCVGPPGAAACAAFVPSGDPVCAGAGVSCDATPGSCCAGTACAPVQSGGRACATLPAL
jgi:hypothetical protein